MSLTQESAEGSIVKVTFPTTATTIQLLKFTFSGYETTTQVSSGSTSSRSVTEISTPEPNNTSSNSTINNTSLADHFPLGQTDLVGSSHGIGGGEQGLSLDQIHFHSKNVVRNCPCRWKSDAGPCDVQLASHSLLAKHIRMHIEQTAATRPIVKDNVFVPLWLNCGWYKCTSTGYTTVQELEQHVETAHLNPKLDLFCPFKDCHDRIIRSYAAIPSHYDDVRSHPRPWTVESLLPTPFGERTRPPAEPSPIDTSSELSVPPYLISCPPVRPWPQGRPDHYVLPNRPRLRDFDVPIVPDRTDDIVFWPVCGDAPPGDLDPCTSSIFPPNKRREEQQQQQSSQREHSNKQPEQQPIIPSASRVHARPFTIRKKVEGKLGRPRLAVAADIWVAHQRKIKAKECRRLAKGKEKMVDEKDVKEEEVKEKPFDQEKIRAAAQRIAAKKVGRWIGIEFWKEVLAFEAEGVALGEIPR